MPFVFFNACCWINWPVCNCWARPGIDFRGGILIEARHNSGPADIGRLRGELESLGLGDISLQGFGTETDILVRVQRQKGDEKAQIAAIQLVSEL